MQYGAQRPRALRARREGGEASGGSHLGRVEEAVVVNGIALERRIGPGLGVYRRPVDHVGKRDRAAAAAAAAAAAPPLVSATVMGGWLNESARSTRTPPSPGQHGDGRGTQQLSHPPGRGTQDTREPVPSVITVPSVCVIGTCFAHSLASSSIVIFGEVRLSNSPRCRRSCADNGGDGRATVATVVVGMATETARRAGALKDMWGHCEGRIAQAIARTRAQRSPPPLQLPRTGPCGWHGNGDGAYRRARRSP